MLLRLWALVHFSNKSLFLFIARCSLDEKEQFWATDLSWDEESWNSPGTAKFEMKSSFDSLVEKSIKKNDTVADSLMSMGWTESTYDCFVNHYEDYDWKDLEEYTDTIPYWTDLGWNSSSWDGDIDYEPESEAAEWKDLTETEQLAAVALCYFEELWSYVDISQWEEFVDADLCAVEMPGNATVAANTSTVDMDEMEEEEEAPATPIEAEVDAPQTEVAEEPQGEVEDDQASSSMTIDLGIPTEGPTEEPEPTEEPKVIDVDYVPNPNNRFLLWSWLFEVSKEAGTTLGK